MASAVHHHIQLDVSVVAGLFDSMPGDAHQVHAFKLSFGGTRLPSRSSAQIAHFTRCHVSLAAAGRSAGHQKSPTSNAVFIPERTSNSPSSGTASFFSHFSLPDRTWETQKPWILHFSTARSRDRRKETRALWALPSLDLQTTFSDRLRRAYAVGGCLFFMWFSTHALLLYNRRAEYRRLNAVLPPISWEEFVEKYLTKQLVRLFQLASPIQVTCIVFQPQFEVGNAYLVAKQVNDIRIAALKYVCMLLFSKIPSQLRVSPERYSRPPDVRFSFEGDLPMVDFFFFAQHFLAGGSREDRTQISGRE